MKSLGEGDYVGQETMHHLLSLKLHSSSFKVMPVSLNGSHRVRDTADEGESCTDYSLLDVYANREQYESSQDIMNMNFVEFATTYKVVNNELTKLPDNIPRIFPTYSPNPKGPNFGLYCMYQLLRYKPWQTIQDNAWGGQEATDVILINSWQDFLQTRMVLSDLHTPFDNSEQTSESTHDWHLDRANYSKQQIHEMPTWIKTKRNPLLMSNMTLLMSTVLVKCKNLLMT